MNKTGIPYRCKWCKQIVLRESKKQWIKSYCDKSGKYVHLVRVNTPRGGERK